MYIELPIKNETYKLRLTTRTSIALEKALGYNPLSMFMALDSGEMPKLTDMLIILHSMLQSLHHGITLDKTYDLFDDFVADGHNIFDLVPVFIEVFQESGYMAKTNGLGVDEEKN
jgi:hypothetical protein